MEGASLADMSASITVKTLSGGAYGFITDTTKVASVKRVEALFSFSLSTGVAMSSKEEIKTQVAAAYGGSSTSKDRHLCLFLKASLTRNVWPNLIICS